MPIQLPPELAIQIQQKNQLYSLAFEIFKQLICKEVGTSAIDIAKNAIKYAKTFMEVVQEDQKNEG